MEYCQGVMILTTNRVTEFDPAALSRIHLKVKYDDLKNDAKSAVWRDFLDGAFAFYGDPSISADELKRLSKTQLNGRKIGNTAAIARKIAIRQESIVLLSHLEQALAASKELSERLQWPRPCQQRFSLVGWEEEEIVPVGFDPFIENVWL